tara:strand:- start:2114 stop:3250 length:1137 start_codon:yes stop_codon:yes gene_type:complete
MKIGIISRSDLDNKLFWSGVPSNIYSNLKKNKKIKVVKIDKLNENLRKIFAIKREYLKIIKKTKFDETYNTKVSKNYASQIEKRLKNTSNISHLLTFDLSLVSYLKTDIPIILWTDILYSDYYRHYFKKQNISKLSFKDIKLLEYKAIKQCKIILISSKWALNKAQKKYKQFKSKFKLLEFGPSLKEQVSEKKIKKNILNRKKNKIKLISLSVDGKRKGVDRQIKLINYMNRKGIKTELTVIGFKPKYNFNKSNLKFLGFINKNDSNGERKISSMLLKSHFHLLFSSAEAYGIALIEANSRAVPNIAFDVGGISHIVKNKKNGRLFKKNEKIEKIGDYLISLINNTKKYKKLAISSFFEFKKNFNNNKIISDFIKLIK